MWASYNGNLEVVKALLLAGADAEAEDYVSGGVEIVGILVVDWSAGSCRWVAACGVTTYGTGSSACGEACRCE